MKELSEQQATAGEFQCDMALFGDDGLSFVTKSKKVLDNVRNIQSRRFVT